ncbi:MAG: hypoxanthine phosphoribosyltransferase [Acidimicrobiales bacterium]
MTIFENDPALGEVLVSQEQLEVVVAELGAQITRDYADQRPLLIAVLKGAFVFMADLVRAIDLDVQMDFMAVSSYGDSTETSGVVRIIKDLDVDMAGRHVILVEDIVDSGLTQAYLRKTLAARHPSSFEVCALLVRAENAEINRRFRYVGLELGPGWVVGYGLDVAERYRNLKEIRAFRTETLNR